MRVAKHLLRADLVVINDIKISIQLSIPCHRIILVFSILLSSIAQTLQTLLESAFASQS